MPIEVGGGPENIMPGCRGDVMRRGMSSQGGRASQSRRAWPSYTLLGVAPVADARGRPCARWPVASLGLPSREMNPSEVVPQVARSTSRLAPGPRVLLGACATV